MEKNLQHDLDLNSEPDLKMNVESDIDDDLKLYLEMDSEPEMIQHDQKPSLEHLFPQTSLGIFDAPRSSELHATNAPLTNSTVEGESSTHSEGEFYKKVADWIMSRPLPACGKASMHCNSDHSDDVSNNDEQINSRIGFDIQDENINSEDDIEFDTAGRNRDNLAKADFLGESNVEDDSLCGEDKSRNRSNTGEEMNDYACHYRQDAGTGEMVKEEFISEDNECFHSEDAIGGSKNNEQELLFGSQKGPTAPMPSVAPKAEDLNAKTRWIISKQMEMRYEIICLRAEQQDLRAEQEDLRAERAEFRAQRAEFRAQRADFRAEQERLRNKCKQLKADREELSADQKQLRVKQEQLRVAQMQVNAEQEKLMADQEQLKAEQQEFRTEQQLPRADKKRTRSSGELPRFWPEQSIPLQLVAEEEKKTRKKKKNESIPTSGFSTRSRNKNEDESTPSSMLQSEPLTKKQQI